MYKETVSTIPYCMIVFFISFQSLIWKKWTTKRVWFYTFFYISGKFSCNFQLQDLKQYSRCDTLMWNIEYGNNHMTWRVISLWKSNKTWLGYMWFNQLPSMLYLDNDINTQFTTLKKNILTINYSKALKHGKLSAP